MAADTPMEPAHPEHVLDELLRRSGLRTLAGPAPEVTAVSPGDEATSVPVTGAVRVDL